MSRQSAADPHDAPVVDLARLQVRAANRCIYCGSTERLTNEHILPAGLGGPASIPKASCDDCARITSAIEREVLRGPLWPLRAFRNIRSRRKHRDAPKTVQITFRWPDGRDATEDIPLAQAPVVFHFPVFAPPAHIDPSGYESGIRICGSATVGFDNDLEALVKSRGALSASMSQTTRPTTFARLIAKIAYCMAWADGSLTLVEEPCSVLPALLGTKDDIGRWVGCYTDSPRRQPGMLHHLACRTLHDTGIVVYDVQLFSDAQAPTYCVVLGHLREKSGAP